jgi:hypothetical protein
MASPSSPSTQRWLRHRVIGLSALLLALAATFASAQDQQPEPDSRAAIIEQQQAEKATQVHPYVPNAAEGYLNYAERVLSRGGMHFHPFFVNAYAGGGFTLGAGYNSYLGSYNTLDVRGSLTPSGYKRLEAEFLAPRLFKRQARLSLLGGWREATEVGWFGTGTATSLDDRANYGFKQPYGVATLDFRPGRRAFALRGMVEATEWQQTPGRGDEPSVDEIYTPETLVGLGSTITYLHTAATVGFDRRPSPDYARRGGFYGVTAHDFHDQDGRYGFRQWDYEAVQHVPLVRETWVLSFRARVTTTATKDDQPIPFFMLPSLGGGSTLRGYTSWRFRDRNTMLMQAEWRVIVNRFFDMGVFYDGGKVAAHARDLDFDDLKHDFGLGFRFHGPLSTPLRIDIARGNEGLRMVWAVGAAF